MWIFLWHAFLWVPKLLLIGAQRVAVWTGTIYLFRKGKEHRIYYFLSAFLYVLSWALFILALRKTSLFSMGRILHWLSLSRIVA